MVALRWSSIFIKEIGARLPGRRGCYVYISLSAPSDARLGIRALTRHPGINMPISREQQKSPRVEKES